MVPLSDTGREDAVPLENILADPSPGPERHAEAASDQDAVQKALDTLSAPLRMAVILVELEGMSREEGARMLGCSLSALDVRLHRAREQLRKRLHHYRAGEA